MATYVPGIQEYIPQVQPFKPDFNFFQSALEMKQAQYQAGYNRISSLYGNLLNSDLLRDPNKQRRDTFFTEIDSDIKRLSGVDLSLVENQKEATGLFQPLIDNDFFRKDLSYTKQYQGQLNKANAYKSNPDSKSDERYWEPGVTALNYQAEEFSKSTDNESLYFKGPEYVPYINGYEKLMAFAKENDLNPETPPVFDGGYIIKTTNGVNAIPTLQNIFSSVLASDPRYRKIFGVESYLDRKNYMKSNAEKFQGDEYAAETEYLATKANEYNEYYRKLSEADEGRLNQISTKKKVIEQKIKTEGVDPDIDPDLVAMYQQLDKDAQVQTTIVEKNKEVTSQFENIDINTLDRELLRSRIDNIGSVFLMDELAGRTAQDYAMGKVKYDIKVDQYALERVKYANNVALEKMKQRHDKTMKYMDILGNVLKENGLLPNGESLNPLANGIYVPDPGSGNITKDPISLQEVNNSSLQQNEDSSIRSTLNTAEQLVNYANAVLDNPSASDAEKTDARNLVEDLGMYEVTSKQEAYEKDIDSNWKTGLIGVGMMGLNAIGGILGLSALTGLSGLGAAGQNVTKIGFFPESEKVPEQITGTKGLITTDSNGRYKVINPQQAKNILNPDSDEYYPKLMEKMKTLAEQTLKTAPQGSSMFFAKQQIDENYKNFKENMEMQTLYQDVIIENNKVIGTALAQEAGTDAETAKLYYSPSMTKVRSENEFIAAYVEANKNNRDKYPNTVGQREPFVRNISDEERLENMQDDAQDLYEELTDAYNELKTNPDGNLPIKAIGIELTGDETGLNKYFRGSTIFSLDPAETLGDAFSVINDFKNKDFTKYVNNPVARNRDNVRITYGDGRNITAEDYASEDYQHDASAETAMNYYLSYAYSKGMNKKNDKRPISNVIFNGVAANDGNKVAVSFSIDPQFINDNAGTEKNKGPMWGIQQKMNSTNEKDIEKGYGNGTAPTITFFMDADKAESAGFRNMQMTKNEIKMQLQGYIESDAYADTGGYTRIEPNPLGGFRYTGYAKAVDATGKMFSETIFGSLPTDNLDEAMTIINEMNKEFSAVNYQMQQQARANSQNKIYNPNELIGN